MPLTSLLVPSVLALLLPAATTPDPSPHPPSAAWLSLLPEGEAKRRFILDCTGCHQFDADIIMVDGRVRTREEWAAAVTRMLGFAGATTGFPVIAAGRDPRATAEWIARYVTDSSRPAVTMPAARRAEVKEFLMPEAGDLPHDVAIEGDGNILVTGMFTHVLYRLHPGSGQFDEIAIPVPNANPRAVELDPLGRAWVVLGKPGKLALRQPDASWTTFDVGMYAHSVAIGRDRVWVNGHFTRDPELLRSVPLTGGPIRTDSVPLHPEMGQAPGGPIPYEVRVGPDDLLWGGELQGNRVFSFSPSRGFKLFTMPTTWSGPRRFDLDARGVVWIPAYSANLLVRLDPATGAFTEIPLPVKDAVPYVVRVDPRDGAIWIGTAAADALFRYDPTTRRFDTIPLPSHGALVRHMAVDPRNGDVWLAYGESPGMPARIARVRLQEGERREARGER